METCTVFPGTKYYREVKRLFLSAFPPEERRPLRNLWLLNVLRPQVALRAYREGDAFCGFTLTVDSEKYLYLSFIAVSPALRGRGCGSEIIGQLRREYPEKALLVEVEAPDEQASNCDQRKKRIEFYRRCGFVDLDRTITGRGVTYRILSTDPDFDRAAYRKIFTYLSFGLRAKLRRLLRKPPCEGCGGETGGKE